MAAGEILESFQNAFRFRRRGNNAGDKKVVPNNFEQSFRHGVSCFAESHYAQALVLTQIHDGFATVNFGSGPGKLPVHSARNINGRERVVKDCSGDLLQVRHAKV